MVPDAAFVLILPQPVPLLWGHSAAAAFPAPPSPAPVPRLPALILRWSDALTYRAAVVSIAASRRTCTIVRITTVINLATTRMPVLLPATARLPPALPRRDCCVRYVAAAPQAVDLIRGRICRRPERRVGLCLAPHLP